MKRLIYILIIFVISCQNIDTNKIDTNRSDLLYEFPSFQTDSIVDKRDKQKYNLIKIGKQWWCVSNIKYKAKEGSWCHRNCDMFGYLYNWEAATKACPAGLKIPSDADWEILFNYIINELIKKSSPKLINNVVKEDFYHPHYNYDRRRRIISFDKINNFDKLNKGEKIIIISSYLQKIGFSPDGNGFKHKGFGHDGGSYFWSTTIDATRDHKYVRLTDFNSYDQFFYLPYNNKFGLNLRCLKK